MSWSMQTALEGEGAGAVPAAVCFALRHLTVRAAQAIAAENVTGPAYPNSRSKRELDPEGRKEEKG